jgi:hypothetical protein
VLGFFVNIGYYSMKVRKKERLMKPSACNTPEDERRELKMLIHKVISMPKLTVM